MHKIIFFDIKLICSDVKDYFLFEDFLHGHTYTRREEGSFHSLTHIFYFSNNFIETIFFFVYSGKDVTFYIALFF